MTADSIVSSILDNLEKPITEIERKEYARLGFSDGLLGIRRSSNEASHHTERHLAWVSGNDAGYTVKVVNDYIAKHGDRATDEQEVQTKILRLYRLIYSSNVVQATDQCEPVDAISWASEILTTSDCDHVTLELSHLSQSDCDEINELWEYLYHSGRAEAFKYRYKLDQYDSGD